MHVTELLINGILRVWRHDGGDCRGFFCISGAVFTTAGRIDSLQPNRKALVCGLQQCIMLHDH